MFLTALAVATAPVTALAGTVGGGADPGAGAIASVVTKQPTAGYFVGANGLVYGYGRDDKGTWSDAALVGAKTLAPAGAPITSARLADGTSLSFYVGNDGAIYGGCGMLWRMTAIKLLRPGTVLTVAVTPAVIMLLFPDDSGGMSGVHVESEIHHPCSLFTDPLPTLTVESLPGSWYTPSGVVAATGLADGRIGVFVSDAGGAIHAEWRGADGKWSDIKLTPGGTTAAGGGIAVAPADGGGYFLFYASSGRVFRAQIVAGGGLRADPEPCPWSVAKIADLAALAAVSGTAGTDVSFVAVDGSVVDLRIDVKGIWQDAVTLGAAGFAKSGRAVAATASSDEVDVYCGTVTGIPGHFGVPPHVPGTVAWRAAGAAGLLPGLGSITAS